MVSLDPSEEDDDGLAGHQRENEVIHLPHILTKHSSGTAEPETSGDM